MSEEARDETVLGKRMRDGDNVPDDPKEHMPAEDDSDDDDIGPMPLPAGTPTNGGAKKKRKGKHLVII
jgi:peptidylprolyl isomerase domain and WD repeat-containing protein 1